MLKLVIKEASKHVLACPPPSMGATPLPSSACLLRKKPHQHQQCDVCALLGAGSALESFDQSCEGINEEDGLIDFGSGRSFADPSLAYYISVDVEEFVDNTAERLLCL